MASMQIPNKIVCKVFVSFSNLKVFKLSRSNVLLQDYTRYVYKSIKVKLLKLLRVLLQFVMGCHSSQTMHSQLITILGNLAASLSNGLSWTVQFISGTVQFISWTVQFISGTVQLISGTVQFISGTVQLVSGTFKRKRKSD